MRPMITRLNNQAINLSGFQFGASAPSLVISLDRFLFRGLNMKTLDIMAISLTQGLFALVDGKNYEWLTQWKWCAHKSGYNYYAERSIGKKPNQKTISMHRQILNAKVNDAVDHANHNGLDNREQNVRIATNSQNQYNRRPNKKSSSRFKGVSWHKSSKKWQSRITYNNKTVYLGVFANEIEAANAYNEIANKMFGEFACLNFGEYN